MVALDSGIGQAKTSAHDSGRSKREMVSALIRDFYSAQQLPNLQDGSDGERERTEILTTSEYTVFEQDGKVSENFSLFPRSMEVNTFEPPSSLCTQVESESDIAFADSPNQKAESEGEMSFIISDKRRGSPVPLPPVPDSASVTIRAHIASLLVEEYLATRFVASGGMDKPIGPLTHAGSTVSTATNPTDTGQARQTARKGRCQKDDEDEDGEKDDESHGGRSSFQRTSLSTKPLACPYFKHEPTRYSELNNTERNYRSCSTCPLKDISRLKQHLYRIHGRPDNYCNRCYQVFQSGIILEEHNRSDPPCQLSGQLFQEKMTSTQIALIKRRRPGKRVHENWSNYSTSCFRALLYLIHLMRRACVLKAFSASCHSPKLKAAPCSSTCLAMSLNKSRFSALSHKSLSSKLSNEPCLRSCASLLSNIGH